jgi:hypothetical protein
MKPFNKNEFLCPGILTEVKSILLDNGFMSTMSILHKYHEVAINLPLENTV